MHTYYVSDEDRQHPKTYVSEETGNWVCMFGWRL
jgi:hypothetical protein